MARAARWQMPFHFMILRQNAQLLLADKMIDRIEPDQAYHDEVDGDDEVQQSWNN
jgi:hypothetical protein